MPGGAVSRVIGLGHGLVRRLGVDLVRYPGLAFPEGRRIRLLRQHGVDVVLDVGANAGQYGAQLRALGYRGRLVSFEPLAEPFEQLRARAAGDGAWEVHAVGLGDRSGRATIHVAGNLVSSSLLEMRPEHRRFAPGSAFTGDREIELQRLDDLFDGLVRPGERAFLKIDAQGYEERVLDGAAASLGRIVGLQVELSLTPLYEGAPRMTAMIDRLEEEGFTLMSLEPGFTDRATGRMLQVDGIFFRSGGGPT